MELMFSTIFHKNKSYRGQSGMRTWTRCRHTHIYSSRNILRHELQVICAHLYRNILKFIADQHRNLGLHAVYWSKLTSCVVFKLLCPILFALSGYFQNATTKKLLFLSKRVLLKQTMHKSYSERFLRNKYLKDSFFSFLSIFFLKLNL